QPDGRYLALRGKLEAAGNMLQRALATAGDVLGLRHPQVVLGVIRLRSDSLRKAITRRQRCCTDKLFEASEDVPDLEPHVHTAIHNLGTVLAAQGQLEEAETMLRWEIEKSEQFFGPDNHETLASIHSLEGTLRMQGKYDKAELIYRQRLEKLVVEILRSMEICLELSFSIRAQVPAGSL
ncbi:MAG: hypothetical protein LQ340_005105, partial [Diploschistes diacapsis]